VENQTSRKIRCLRSNNGGEYTSNAFDDFCAREGIRREMIVAYNPQQNGVAKRKNMTPDEAFTGQKPQVGHLRIFGCVTYSFIPKEKRRKMEPTAEKGIFVGYSEISKAYRIYIPALRSVVVRRDVKFEEQRAYQRSRDLDQREPPTSSTQQGSSGQGSGPQESGPHGSGGTSVSGVTRSQVVVPQVIR